MDILWRFSLAIEWISNLVLSAQVQSTCEENAIVKRWLLCEWATDDRPLGYLFAVYYNKLRILHQWYDRVGELERLERLALEWRRVQLVSNINHFWILCGTYDRDQLHDALLIYLLISEVQWAPWRLSELFPTALLKRSPARSQRSQRRIWKSPAL